MARSSIHGEWSSKLAFVLAATGSAVGLGNIWRFPYLAGENGGGAFVLVYLLCIASIGIPTMMSEVMLGRRGRRSPINTMRVLATEEGASPAWQLLGWMGVIAGFLILSFYSVIGGWALAYVVRSASAMFVGLTAADAKALFAALKADPWQLIGWHTAFMLITAAVVARGVQTGLEHAVRYLMPALFVLLTVLVGYAIVQGEFARGLWFLFRPDFGRLSANAVLAAMGQAFFTLSLGMGAIMIYGSYLPSDASIARTSVTVAVADTVVALVAGMAIFPIVFANALEPSTGPGLIFQSLPISFGQMPGGVVFGTLFFLLLVFAAWTSAISLLEPAVAWLVETREMGRIAATLACAAATWVVGLGTVFSFNIWSDLRVFDKTVFDLLDYLTANILLPLGGLMIAIFAGWRMARAATEDELALGKGLAYWAWRSLVRYVTPVGVMAVFLNAIGVI